MNLGVRAADASIGAVRVLVVAAALAAAHAEGAGLTIGAGSTMSLGGAQVDLGCGDFANAGQFNAQAGAVRQIDNLDNQGGAVLDAGSSTLQVTGDFSNTGTFIAGTGTVAIADGCGNTTSNVTGSTTFNNLQLTTSTGKTVVFAAGSITTVGGTFVAQGAAGNLLHIRSSNPGDRATIDVTTGNAAIGFVDVQDNSATRDIGLQGAAALGSIKGPNTPGWFIPRSVEFPIPALGTLGLALLATLLFALSWRARRGRLPDR